ncbi:hypothetical protein DERF_001656 [Dermatophagoides farinae]|uniref:Uncharacterized protein n=1 Tax=Dermatophagoides farinae TaxID=6954 RepID=A0A922L9L9_DERFA|nr:hypothetical protein DERF_001656 [Dermatophagoides farinae]
MTKNLNRNGQLNIDWIEWHLLIASSRFEHQKSSTRTNDDEQESEKTTTTTTTYSIYDCFN